MQLLVDNDTFLTQLEALFRSSETHGSVWLTHKRFTYDGENSSMKQEEGSTEAREYPCLLRATDGKKVNISTRVEPGRLEKFHVAYGILLKGSLTTLRKRDKKREKQRTEQALKRKKKMTEPFEIKGPKRGNGRRKTQRLIKASAKQSESQKKFNQRDEERHKHKTAAQLPI